MRVDLCRYWPSLQPHLTALLVDVKMTFLINDPVSLCLPGLLFLGMSFSLFSTFCVLIFFLVLYLGSIERNENKRTLYHV